MGDRFSGQLRRALRDSGHTMYNVCVQTGIDQAALSKFLSGKRGLSLESIDTLMDFLDLEITPRKRKAK